MSRLPQLVITTSVALKGSLPPEAIEEIIAIAQEHGVEIGLRLTGTRDKDAEVGQLRLLLEPEPQWAKDLNMDYSTGELLG